MRHDFTATEFDRFTRDRRDRLTGYHRFLYCGHHQGTAYYLPTTTPTAATSADCAHVRHLGRAGHAEVCTLGELCEHYTGQFIPEYGPDRHADGRLRAGNDAPIEQADEAGAVLSREHVRRAMIALAHVFGPLDADKRSKVNAHLANLGLREVEEPRDSRDGVHQSHCCSVHGCKYGDTDCPVGVTGRLAQDHPCEQCQDDDEVGVTLSREHVRAVLTRHVRDPHTGPIARDNVNAMLRELGLDEVEEPYKIVTVEVKIKYRGQPTDTDASDHAASRVHDAVHNGIRVDRDVISVEATGVEEVR